MAVPRIVTVVEASQYGPGAFLMNAVADDGFEFWAVYEEAMPRPQLGDRFAVRICGPADVNALPAVREPWLRPQTQGGWVLRITESRLPLRRASFVIPKRHAHLVPEGRDYSLAWMPIAASDVGAASPVAATFSALGA